MRSQPSSLSESLSASTRCIPPSAPSAFSHSCRRLPLLTYRVQTMSPSRLRLLALSVHLLLLFLLLLPGVFPQAPNVCGTKANGRYACPDCTTSAITSNRGDAAFEANLLRLRDSLRDMAATNASFLNATFAAFGAQEDVVYGLATCFADAEMADCAACLAGAATELPLTRCAGRRDMVLWYPRCLVRYDNGTAFFGVADTSPDRRFSVPNPNNFSDPAALEKARTALNARMLAAAAESPLRFAFDDEAVNPNTTLHGLAQCTEDLAVEECTRCLATHMVWLGVCYADMDGVRLIGASCYLRYEFMAFAPGTPPSMAPLAEPPSASSSGTGTSSKNPKTAYVALGGGVLLLLVVGACC